MKVYVNKILCDFSKILAYVGTVMMLPRTAEINKHCCNNNINKTATTNEWLLRNK